MARSRAQPQLTARLHERAHVVPPRALVEVDGQKPAGLVVLHRIDAHYVLALQVGNHGFVVDGFERLPTQSPYFIFGSSQTGLDPTEIGIDEGMIRVAAVAPSTLRETDW